MRSFKFVQIQHVLLFFVVISTSGWLGQISHAQLEYEYAIFKVKSLGGISERSWGTNNFGNVVGSGVLEDTYDDHPFISILGKDTIDLGTFGGRDGVAKGVNNNGAVAGYAHTTDTTHAVVWTRETGKIDLGSLGGVTAKAYAINDNGQICGYAQQEFGMSHAFIWENGIMTDLSLPFPDEYSEARGISNSGVVVGEFRNKAAMWRDGEYIDLEYDGTAYDVNDLEQVVGDIARTPSLWVDGVWYDLSRSGFGKKGTSYAINNRSEIVGYTSQGSIRHAFIWTPQKGLRLLADLIPPNSFALLEIAKDIAENGIITAEAKNLTGDYSYWATVLIPVKPEILLSDPIPGIAGELNRWKVSQVEPGVEVSLYYSLHGGGAIVKGCDEMDAVLQLQKPKLVETAIANENGIAYFEIHVADKASSLGPILIQAVSIGECQESQLRVYEF